jgi:2Fe-2S ferredoxin
MIKIHLKNLNKTIDYNPAEKKNILDIILDQNIHLDHACGGNAACSTCHIKVKEGMKNLNEIDEIEEDLIDFAADADLTSRLACQCFPQKDGLDITLEIPDQKGLH